MLAFVLLIYLMIPAIILSNKLGNFLADLIIEFIEEKQRPTGGET